MFKRGKIIHTFPCICIKYPGSRNKMLKIKVGWNEGNRVTRGPSVKNTCHYTFLNFETCFNFKKKKKDKNELARFAYEGCGIQPLRQLPIKPSPPCGIPILPHCTTVGLCKQKNMPLLRLGYRKYRNLSLGLSLRSSHTLNGGSQLAHLP